MVRWIWRRLTAKLRDQIEVAEAEARHWRKELINLRASIGEDACALSRANARADGAESARLALADECGRLRQELRAIRDRAAEAAK